MLRLQLRNRQTKKGSKGQFAESSLFVFSPKTLPSLLKEESTHRKMQVQPSFREGFLDYYFEDSDEPNVVLICWFER